jgi:hypothetical protein
MASLVEECKAWGYDQWNDFDNPKFQETLKKLPKADQEEIIRAKDLFWKCHASPTPNAISEGENSDPPDSYEQYLEETRKKQEKYIKERGASFVFYQSFIEALEDLDEKQFRECILALCDYGLFQEKREYKGAVKMFMTMVMPLIDANERKRLTAQLNGKHGGAPTGNHNARKG